MQQDLVGFSAGFFFPDFGRGFFKISSIKLTTVPVLTEWFLFNLISLLGVF